MSRDSTFEKQSWDFEGRRIVKNIFPLRHTTDVLPIKSTGAIPAIFQQNISGRKNEELNLNPLIYGSIINVALFICLWRHPTPSHEKSPILRRTTRMLETRLKAWPFFLPSFLPPVVAIISNILTDSRGARRTDVPVHGWMGVRSFIPSS